MMQVGFYFILFSSHDYCYEFHPLESYLRVIYVFAKGPAGDCEDDICFDIIVLWTPYLYLDVCLQVRFGVGRLEC